MISNYFINNKARFVFPRLSSHQQIHQIEYVAKSLFRFFHLAAGRNARAAPEGKVFAVVSDQVVVPFSQPPTGPLQRFFPRVQVITRNIAACFKITNRKA